MSKKHIEKDDPREFPETIHVSFDLGAKYDEERPELLACYGEAEAVDGDGPTRIAQYRLVREGVFRKQTVED
jgi:hypothetical protein